MQTTPATALAQERAEAAEDLFEKFFADQVIDLEEARQLRAALRRTVHSTARADVSRALGVCLIRGGVGSPRHHRLMREWDALEAMTPAAEIEPITPQDAA